MTDAYDYFRSYIARKSRTAYVSVDHYRIDENRDYLDIFIESVPCDIDGTMKDQEQRNEVHIALTRRDALMLAEAISTYRSGDD